MGDVIRALFFVSVLISFVASNNSAREYIKNIFKDAPDANKEKIEKASVAPANVNPDDPVPNNGVYFYVGNNILSGGGGVYTIQFDGEINEVNAKEFVDIINYRKKEYQDRVGRLPYIQFVINSPGGSVDLAIEMGRAIRSLGENGSPVFGDKNSVCLSSCVFVLAGGVQRFFEGRVGIHRPFTITAQTWTEHNDELRRVDAMAKKYLSEVNVNPDLYDEMVAIEPHDVRFLPYPERTKYGLGFQDRNFADMRENEIAAQLGLSRVEYNAKKSKVNNYCNQYEAGDGNSYANCYRRLMGL